MAGRGCALFPHALESSLRTAELLLKRHVSGSLPALQGCRGALIALVETGVLSCELFRPAPRLFVRPAQVALFPYPLTPVLRVRVRRSFDPLTFQVRSAGLFCVATAAHKALSAPRA